MRLLNRQSEDVPESARSPVLCRDENPLPKGDSDSDVGINEEKPEQLLDFEPGHASNREKEIDQKGDLTNIDYQKQADIAVDCLSADDENLHQAMDIDLETASVCAEQNIFCEETGAENAEDQEMGEDVKPFHRM